jgi:hypothetical protein
LKFNKGEAYPDEEAYDVRILAMIPDVSINVESENGNTESVESEDNFANEVESAKNALLADHDAEIS